MNKIEPKTLPGFMELLPNDQIEFNRIKNIIENTYKSYGFFPLDTPIIEYSSVLLAKAGGETEKQIYRFNKGDNDLSLRFDLTVPLAKYVAKNYNELPFPFKRYQIGKVYRGERPQKGRFREFYQCDIDVIGNESLSLKYDSEIPSIIYDIFKKLDFGKFKIRINNRKILSGFFEYLNLENEVTNMLRIIDKIDKIGIDKTKEMLSDIVNSDKKINDIIDFITIDGSNEEKIFNLEKQNINNQKYIKGVEELKSVIEDLKLRKLPFDSFEIDLKIARGLDYYTGTVYETILIDYPNIGSVCSGGRYDDLAQFYTDKKLPGVGISIGLTRLYYALKEIGVIKEKELISNDICILSFSESNYIYDVINKIKELNLSINVPYIDGNFKQKMKYANKIGCKYIIIIGEDEISNKTISIKNMITGNQQNYKLDEINFNTFNF